MQIVIPMSGFGERFRRAGYAVPKPLIEIDGKAIIEHVLDMFPGETDVTFICNQDHLDTPEYGMEELLRRLCPTGRVVGIPAHKLGPVHAVRQVEHLLDDDRPVVVNYCDFTCYWDWSDFRSFVEETDCAGAVPAYRGFHPHTLGTTNYAYMRERDGWMLDIQEKQPFTDNRMEEYASSGTYYFQSGALMRDAFRATVEQGLDVGGEYYVSLAYRPLLDAGEPVAVYDLQHFMQWGTPDDVAEYRHWSRTFRLLLETRAPDDAAGSLVVPMAGLGQRFADEGYTQTKPLIPVSGTPMVLQAIADLPAAERHSFVLRADMPGHDEIAAELERRFPGSTIHTVAHVTEGQACTALIGLEALQAAGKVPGPVTFGACDNGALYDRRSFRRCFDEDEADVLVWVVRGHASAVRRPQMFGWVDAEADGAIRGISVKQPLADPTSDPIVLGTFSFRNGTDPARCIERLVERDGRVNGEFYLDSCIEDALALGLRCRIFEVDSYLAWGTPDELRTFEYWQSCFHKWDGHPYSLADDVHVPQGAQDDLAARYARTRPRRPKALTA